MRAKFLNVLIEALEDDPEIHMLDTEAPPDDIVSADDPEYTSVLLSDLSCNGFNGTTTLKLFSRVGDHRLLTMIDSGASHCFLSESVAAKLGLQVSSSSDFHVILSDGSRVPMQGLCKAVPLTLDRHTFLIDC